MTQLMLPSGAGNGLFADCHVAPWSLEYEIPMSPVKVPLAFQFQSFSWVA
jgi:prepilin-type processing-associated H-X9-DG protein